MCAQNNHGMPRDTPIHPYTLTHSHSTAEGSRTIILVASFKGYGGSSSTGALLLLTEGLVSLLLLLLLLNHSRRVGLPTMLRMLSWACSLSSLESDGVNRSMCMEFFLFRCIPSRQGSSQDPTIPCSSTTVLSCVRVGSGLGGDGGKGGTRGEESVWGGRVGVCCCCVL